MKRPRLKWLRGIEEEVERIFHYARPPEPSGEVGVGKKWIPLDKNENFFLPETYVRKILSKCLGEVDVRRYPEEEETRFKERLCGFLETPPENVVVGNGCDDLIDIACHTFLRPGDDAIVVAPTFLMYRWSVERRGANVVETYLREDFSLDIASITSRASQKTRLCFICSPNNPTGNQFNPDEILEIGESLPSILIVDETYVDFADGSCVDLLDQLDNLVILRTFSKIGFAGLRLGYALSNPRIIGLMEKFIRPYSLDSLSLKVGFEALGDYEPIRRALEAVISERERLTSELKTIEGVTPHPSKTNFILVEVGKDVSLIHRSLLGTGVLVKNLRGEPLLSNHLRVSVGTPEMNEVFLNGLREAMGR